MKNLFKSLFILIKGNFYAKLGLFYSKKAKKASSDFIKYYAKSTKYSILTKDSLEKSKELGENA